MGEIQIKEGAPVPSEKKPKQKAIWWRVLLAFFGGFLCFPLVVVGAGAIVGTVFTTRQVVEMAGGNPDDVLGAKYQSQTILQSVMTLINDQKYDTLEDINEISPMVEKLITETINPVLEENLHYTLNWDELKTVKLNGEGSDSIGEYLKTDITNGIHLVDFIEGSEDLRGVLKYILYDVVKDENGKAVEDEDGNVSIDENNPYSIADIMNGGSSFFNQIIDYIKIGDVIEVTSSSPKILQVMGNWRIGNISDKLETMKLSALFDEKDLEDNALIGALGDLTVSDLSDSDKLMNAIMKLKLKDIISDIEEGTVLYSFKDKTMDEIKDTDMDSMYLADLLKKETYVLTPGKTAEYNKVIGAMVENERKDRYKKDTGLVADDNIAAYNAWLEANPENAKYKATINTLTAPSSIDNLKLSDILDNSAGSKVIQALFDKGATIANMSSVVDSLTLGEVMDIEEGSLLDYPNIKNIPISNSSSLITEIKSTVDLNRVIDINDSSPQILKTLTDYTGMSGGKPTFGPNGAKIGNISSKLEGMKLGEVITIGPGDSAIMQALKDKYVFGDDPGTNLTGAMNNLKFNEVFTWDDCKDNSIMRSLWSNNSDGDFVITNIASAMDNVGLLDVLDDKVYSTKRIVWKASEEADSVAFTLSAETHINDILVTYYDGADYHDVRFMAGTDTGATSVTKDDVTIEGGAGTNLSAGPYSFKNTITVTSDLGENITRVIFLSTATEGKTVANISAATGTIKKAIDATWWFLLTNSTECAGWKLSDPERLVEKTDLGAGKTYKVSDFDKLVVNMEYHMKNETLDDLAEADLITIDLATRNKTIPVGLGTKRVGSMTMDEFMTWASGIIAGL